LFKVKKFIVGAINPFTGPEKNRGYNQSVTAYFVQNGEMWKSKFNMRCFYK